MTYALATELLDGEEREAIRLLAGQQSVTIHIEDAPIFWPHVIGQTYASEKISVMRGADYVKIEANHL